MERRKALFKIATYTKRMDVRPWGSFTIDAKTGRPMSDEEFRMSCAIDKARERMAKLRKALLTIIR